MNKLKKLICILIAALMLLSFAACGKKSDAGKEKNETAGAVSAVDDKEEVEKTVSDFMDAICELNLEDASTYIKGEVDLPFKSKEDYTEAVMKEAFGEDSPFDEESEEDLKPLLEMLFDGVQESMEYEITDCAVDGDTATASVKFTMIDTDAVSFDDIDFENTDFDFESYYQELLTSGAITKDSSQDEMLKAMLPKIVELYSSELQKKFDETETKTEDLELKLEKSEGKWIISDSGGAFEELNFDVAS